MQSADDKTRLYRRPLSTLIFWIQDGRALRAVFLALVAMSVVTVGYDLQYLVAHQAGTPGLQRLEPAQFEPPVPGDQTRPYLPKTMPLGPARGKPELPGYFGPLDGSVMAEPMSFHVGDEGRVSALGTITPGTAKRLEKFLSNREKQMGEFFLHSPGGSVSDALKMSKMIRMAGISTVVPKNGYCASSCPLVLAGGLYRRAGKGAWIGVHQIYAPEPATGTLQTGMRDAQSVSALCQRLLDEMDVDPRVWIYAMQTRSESLYIFTPTQLSRLKLANHQQTVTRPQPRPDLPG